MRKKNKRVEILEQIIKEKPTAVLVANKYKVIFGMLKRLYPNQIEKIPQKIFIDIIFDAVNGNRDWQTLTEGCDKENKEILRQQYIVNNFLS